MKENYDALRKLANMEMPYGKFKGRLLVNLPEPYLLWLRDQQQEKSSLGMMITEMYEMKANGTDHLLRPLIHQ
jgi:uncharacterized protein